MPQYDNNNAGALFNNDRKRDDKDPDRSGTAEVDGVQYWVKGWINKTKDGKTYLKMKFQKKDEEGGGGSNRQSNRHEGF